MSRMLASLGIGVSRRDFQQSYNCQAVVDHAHQVIVAARADFGITWGSDV